MPKRSKLADGFPERLRQAIRESGQSLNQLGRKAKVDHGRLSRFMRGERDLTLDAAGRLCEALGIKLLLPEPVEPQVEKQVRERPRDLPDK
jgi:transcriptional regulator with XRE-family HTH domain